jgi:hypothetical protein
MRSQFVSHVGRVQGLGHGVIAAAMATDQGGHDQDQGSGGACLLSSGECGGVVKWHRSSATEPVLSQGRRGGVQEAGLQEAGSVVQVSWWHQGGLSAGTTYHSV